jgi:hypothetical protein
MKNPAIILIIVSFAMAMASFSPVLIPTDKTTLPVNFYEKSLHFTNRGIAFMYAKENGGLERLTGKPPEEIGCMKAKCHATSCDDCHMKENGSDKIYTLDSSVYYKACIRCHGDMAKENDDVHFKKGMKCMDCHTSKEIHGNGTDTQTYQAPGFFDAACEKCHKSITQSKSHTVHGNKLSCEACHSGETGTCLNCHIDSRLKGSKDVSVSLKNMTFLVNHNGKVTPANMLSYVYGSKTMITFAPTFGHSIKKAGRKCNECHGTKTVSDMADNKFRLVKWENDSLRNEKGVIPVLDGFDWNLVYLERVNDNWVPLKNPAQPLLNYSGYCSPITKDQFEKLR